MGQTLIGLDQVNKCLTADIKSTPSRSEAAASIEVTGGTVNVYMSNRALNDKPADKTEMKLDSSSPLAEDIHSLNVAVRWILFESASGTPVVRTTNVVAG